MLTFWDRQRGHEHPQIANLPHLSRAPRQRSTASSARATLRPMRRFAAFLKALRLSAAHVLRDVGPHVGRPIFDKGTQLDIGATLFQKPISPCGGDTFAGECGVLMLIEKRL